MLERGLAVLAGFMLNGEHNMVYGEQTNEQFTTSKSTTTTLLNDVLAACKMLGKVHHYGLPTFPVHPPSVVHSPQTSSAKSSSSSSSGSPSGDAGQGQGLGPGSPLLEHPVRDGLWGRLCYFIAQSSTCTHTLITNTASTSTSATPSTSTITSTTASITTTSPYIDPTATVTVPATATTTTSDTSSPSQVPSQFPSQLPSQTPSQTTSQIVPLTFAQSISLITGALAVGAGEVAASLAVGAAHRRVH